ncbi:MAG: hypothetical protein K2N60_12055 [Oscillospiraceae bacterium]|nr:hypothetical protein [Oscillospiraceae bacterium]
MSALVEYKCPCCGGAIEFNSNSQKMKCPYCDTEFEIEALKEFTEASQSAGDSLDWDCPDSQWGASETAGMNVYTCKSCGGQIVTDKTTAASACPYCDNPIVMTGQFEGGLRPDMIIPFKIDKEAAKNALSNYLKGKFLLPRSFKAEHRIDEIKGVYVPFWLFDCDADANIRYRATRVRSWTSGNYRYTETSHYLIVRDGSIQFEKVPVDGSQKMPDELSEAIEPYNYGDCVNFNTAYLAGYLADKYDVSAEQSRNRANERIRNSTQQEFRNTVKGYATVVPETVNIRLNSGKIRYALLPVWMLSTTYKGKVYRFAMNGQTGKFVGNLPADYGRLFGLFAGVTAAVTVLTFLVQLFM